MKKTIALLGLTALVFVACQTVEDQSVVAPRMEDAMGWTLDNSDDEFYLEVSVESGGFAEVNGFQDGDRINLESFQPVFYDDAGLVVDLTAEELEPSDYRKNFYMELCEGGSFDFEVLRGEETIQLKNLQLPKMECA